MRWEKLVEILHVNSPHDYEKYIACLYNFDEPEYLRKIKAFKLVISKVCKYGLYIHGVIPDCAESKCNARLDVQLYVSKLAKYDVISFNLFDTFIIRNIMNFTDKYVLIGMKLGINGFGVIRQKAEQEARERKKLYSSNDVVDLCDIYGIIQEWCDIKPEVGLEAEIAVETAISEVNPYWHKVADQLIEAGKTVILLSDDALHASEIRVMLEQMGMNWNGHIFTACDCSTTKQSGKLYDHIKRILGTEKNYVHIGSNLADDMKIAKNCQWDSVFYIDVHKAGRPYRRIGKSIVTESVAGGIIDTTLHNGIQGLSDLEEFGFNYFGRLHVGYCQWLDHLAKNEQIDKLLFVSRDGYLIRKIYRDYFGKVPSEYIYVSRYALSQITVEENMESFIRQNLEPKASERKMTVAAVFEQLQLGQFVSELEDVGIMTDSVLCRENLKSIRTFLYYNRKRVAKVYEPQCIAAEKYFKEILADCNKICVVDIGWHGTCIAGVMEFVNKHIGWHGEILGAQIGLECDANNIGLNALSKIHVYAFSPTFNIDLYRQHDFDLINVVDEIVFSAPEPSLLQYALSEQGEVENIFAEEPQENIEIVRSIHNGVMKYVEKYSSIMSKLGMQIYIPAQVAYRPIVEIIQKRKYINELLGEYKVQRNCGIVEGSWNDVRSV